MVVYLRVCVCVCVWKILGKLQTLVAPTSYWQTLNYTRIKNIKAFAITFFNKVIIIFTTHGYCFQIGEDSWGHLDTSKCNYSCIIAITTKKLHQSKKNWDSGCYNIKHWLLSKHSPWKLFSSFAYFKWYALHMIRNVLTCY